MSYAAAVGNKIHAVASAGQHEPPEFPYHHLRDDVPSAKDMFDRIKNYDSKFNVNDNKYPLSCYMPKSLPRDITYKGKYCTISSEEDMWDCFDSITDHFTEEVRVKARVCYVLQSPYDYWRKSYNNIIRQARITEDNIENIIYNRTKGAGILRPSWIVGIIKKIFPNESYKDKRILNPSAGWGPSLVVSAALDMNYLGIDPNLELQPGLDRIIEELGDSNKQKMIYQPFEDVELTETYDMVIWSPPYFSYEIYSKDDTQSIIRYPEFDQWMDKFLLPCTTKAWNSMNSGAYMIIHLADSKFSNMCDPINDHISTLPGSNYIGVIGVSGAKSKFRPVWVWCKD